MAARDDASGWLYISPLMLVLLPFFVAPILVIFAASFMQSDGFGGIIVNPTLQNYIDIFSSGLTLNLYYETIKFTLLTWLFSLIIGFWVAYFLVFHIRNPLLAIGLFLLCTVPFWTSNIIRMISWIPLLGKEGLINMALMKVGAIHEPLEFLLFSGFSVVVAYVHQLTIFMIVPIFNSMGRIDKRVVEAALDAGASRFDIMRYIILPLSKNGIALGTIFVVSIVMGDFFVIKVMSGGGSASVVGALYEDVGVLQYPSAAASAVVLTVLVKGLMFPISRKAAMANIKMQELQPEIKKIKEKFKDDKEALTKETMAVWKRHNVNPAAGCIPALIQMPIFVGLWQSLNNSVALRHSSFLYIRDPHWLLASMVGVGFASLGAALSILRLSPAGARGAEHVRIREDQRLKGE